MELFNEGLKLMLIGMGVVFLFLTLLVFAVKGMQSLVINFEAAHKQDGITKAKHLPRDKEVAAVITAAVHRYRSEHQHQSGASSQQDSLD